MLMQFEPDRLNCLSGDTKHGPAANRARAPDERSAATHRPGGKLFEHPLRSFADEGAEKQERRKAIETTGAMRGCEIAICGVELK